jgi:hypothetical protein
MTTVHARALSQLTAYSIVFVLLLLPNPSFSYTIDSSCNNYPGGINTMRLAVDEAINMAVYGQFRLTSPMGVNPTVNLGVLNALLGSQATTYFSGTYTTASNALCCTLVS